MDLTQHKLSKAEWQSIEIPICREEQLIVDMICKAFHDINYSHNPSSSLMSHIKIVPSSDIHQQLYITYFQDYVKKLIKKYELDIKPPSVKGCKIRSADRIRIQHTEESLMQQKENIK